MSVCVSECVCVCVCVYTMKYKYIHTYIYKYVCTHKNTHTHTHTNIHISSHERLMLLGTAAIYVYLGRGVGVDLLKHELWRGHLKVLAAGNNACQQLVKHVSS